MRVKGMKIRKRITKAVALLTAALMTLLSSVISTGAITVVRDGKEYVLASHTPTIGEVNVLMIRLGFADYPIDDEDDPAESEETLLSYFNGSEDSVNGFYETSSYGKLRLHCDKVYNYNAIYDRDDYDDAEYTVDDLLQETLSALDSEIDPESYDSDGDGYLDIVCFVFSGPMGAWATTWWPHVASTESVALSGKKSIPILFSGATLTRSCMSSDISSARRTTIPQGTVPIIR